jgi:hypothetical protein
MNSRSRPYLQLNARWPFGHEVLQSFQFSFLSQLQFNSIFYAATWAPIYKTELLIQLEFPS